jgi:hypothetical protein
MEANSFIAEGDTLRRMLKGRIEKLVPTVFLSLSNRDLERLRADEMVEVDGGTGSALTRGCSSTGTGVCRRASRHLRRPARVYGACMPLFGIVIQELPKPRGTAEPALVGQAVRALDVEVEAERPEDAVAKGWEAWDAKYPGPRPEAGRCRVFDPIPVEG